MATRNIQRSHAKLIFSQDQCQCLPVHWKRLKQITDGVVIIPVSEPVHRCIEHLLDLMMPDCHCFVIFHPHWH